MTGNELKTKRGAMPQTRLAELTGFSVTYISRAECMAESRIPRNLETAAKLALKERHGETIACN